MCNVFYDKIYKMAKHNDIGKIGEKIAQFYLKDKGFLILETNFTCKLGEIDIICVKDNKLIFIEVKTKSVSLFKEIEDNTFMPEKRISHEKKKKILKAIRNYLNYNKIDESKTNIEISAIIVFLNDFEKKAKIKFYENILY